MNKSLALKNKLYLFLLLILSFFLFVYLFYFLLNGDRGIIAYFKLEKLNSTYETRLSNLEIKNDFYIDRLKRLKTSSLDLDFLEEKIREKTGYINKNELIIKFD